MNTERTFNMKASVKLPQINPETGKKEGVKHNANIIIDWTGCTEEEVFWFANRQFKIRAGTALQAEGLPFEEGKTYRAKDYLPGDRAPRKPMDADAIAKLAASDPNLLARLRELIEKAG